MTSIDDERNAAAQAETALRELKLSPSKNVEETVEILRNACRAAASAGQGFSSEVSLNQARHEVGIAFPDLIKELTEKTPLGPKLDRAMRAVEDWKSKLVAP